MAPQFPQNLGLQGLQRFDKYYISGGDLFCIAENKLFRVHRYFFERESTFFKEQLAVPATPGAPRLGGGDDSAIILDNVKSADFAKLLWVFYNPKYSLYDATIEDWSTILELAERWGFAEVKSLAVRELEKKEMLDVDRIVLYHKFSVDETYLIPRYAALCERPELLTVEEGLRLGMATVIPLSRARECMRNSASNGARSPSPSVGDKELTEIIKDHFNIKPVPAAGGFVMLSFAGRALIDEVQMQQKNRSRSRHSRPHLLSRTQKTQQSPTQQSPTQQSLRTPVPYSRTRRLGHLASPTAPVQIERAKITHEELDNAEDGGDSGYESTGKTSGDVHHESTCDELKLNANEGHDCDDVEHSTTENGDIEAAAAGSELSAVNRGQKPELTVEVPALTPSIGDRVQTSTEWLVDVDGSAAGTEGRATETQPAGPDSQVNQDEKSTAEVPAISSVWAEVQTPTAPSIGVGASAESEAINASPAETDAQSPEANQEQNPTPTVEVSAATPSIGDRVQTSTEWSVDVNGSAAGTEGGAPETQPAELDSQMNKDEESTAEVPAISSVWAEVQTPTAPCIGVGASAESEAINASPAETDAQSPEANQEQKLTPTVEVSAVIPALGDGLQAPADNADAMASDDEESDEFYDSPEGPQGV